VRPSRSRSGFAFMSPARASWCIGPRAGRSGLFLPRPPRRCNSRRRRWPAPTSSTRPQGRVPDRHASLVAFRRAGARPPGQRLGLCAVEAELLAGAPGPLSANYPMMLRSAGFEELHAGPGDAALVAASALLSACRRRPMRPQDPRVRCTTPLAPVPELGHLFHLWRSLNNLNLRQRDPSHDRTTHRPGQPCGPLLCVVDRDWGRGFRIDFSNRAHVGFASRANLPRLVSGDRQPWESKSSKYAGAADCGGRQLGRVLRGERPRVRAARSPPMTPFRAFRRCGTRALSPIPFVRDPALRRDRAGSDRPPPVPARRQVGAGERRQTPILDRRRACRARAGGGARPNARSNRCRAAGAGWRSRGSP